MGAGGILTCQRCFKHLISKFYHVANPFLDVLYFFRILAQHEIDFCLSDFQHDDSQVQGVGLFRFCPIQDILFECFHGLYQGAMVKRDHSKEQNAHQAEANPNFHADLQVFETA
ncbi:MAG: hypothetical protein HQL79_09315 [Magnetococcales bacterium]|nr:hypothetical protein [Magnetococcales bacterium]